MSREETDVNQAVSLLKLVADLSYDTTEEILSSGLFEDVIESARTHHDLAKSVDRTALRGILGLPPKSLTIDGLKIKVVRLGYFANTAKIREELFKMGLRPVEESVFQRAMSVGGLKKFPIEHLDPNEVREFNGLTYFLAVKR